MTQEPRLPAPLGFPLCSSCPFLINGTPRICATCAGRAIQPISKLHCEVCSQTLSQADAVCSNAICRWTPEQRFFTRVDALALYSGSLETVLRRFKYPPRRHGWAAIFGRLLIGWLETHADQVADIDLIVGNPTEPGRQPFQHIEMIMAAATTEDTAQRWPLARPETPILTKTIPTPRSAGGSWDAKMTAARAHAAALELHADISGQRILLIDDIFTTGAQIHTVSQYLVQAGHAREVRGLVLARVPWRS